MVPNSLKWSQRILNDIKLSHNVSNGSKRPRLELRYTLCPCISRFSKYSNHIILKKMTETSMYFKLKAISDIKVPYNGHKMKEQIIVHDLMHQKFHFSIKLACHSSALLFPSTQSALCCSGASDQAVKKYTWGDFFICPHK